MSSLQVPGGAAGPCVRLDRARELLAVLCERWGVRGVSVVVDSGETWMSLTGRVIHVHPDALALPDDELAASLAHEVSHVRRRHADRQYYEDYAALVVLSGIALVGFAFVGLASALAFELVGFGVWVACIPMRRRAHESQADADAAKLVQACGLAVDGRASMAGALEAAARSRVVAPVRRMPAPGSGTLGRFRADGAWWWASFRSDHPSIPARVASLRSHRGA